MEAFTTLTGLVAPLDRTNVNTDQITPARVLKTIRRTGFDGFRCIIAPSFADIFYNNCFNNGILPVTLDEAIVRELFTEVEATEGYTLTVDLAAQTVVTPDQRALHFEIDGFRKNALLQGLDNIGWTLSHKDEIAAYEARRKQEAPWVFAK